MFNKHKKTGYTLAEALLTLVLIGVIAGVCIPALVQNRNDQQLYLKFRKIYSDLDNATSQILQQRGTTLENTWASNAGVRNSYVVPADVNTDAIMNTIRVCNTSNTQGCWHSAQILDENPTLPGAVLSNGAWVLFALTDAGCSIASGGVNNVCSTLVIDVNGAEQPNRAGDDTFLVFVTRNGISPAGLGTVDCTSTTANRWFCSAAVMVGDNDTNN